MSELTDGNPNIIDIHTNDGMIEIETQSNPSLSIGYNDILYSIAVNPNDPARLFIDVLDLSPQDQGKEPKLVKQDYLFTESELLKAKGIKKLPATFSREFLFAGKLYHIYRHPDNKTRLYLDIYPNDGESESTIYSGYLLPE